MRRTWRVALVAGVLVAVLAATSAGAAKLITGGDIKNGSIGLRDLSRAAKRSLRGTAGPAGPAGPQGPAGPASLSTTIRSQTFTIPDAGVARGEVRCPAGMVAIGGGVSPGALSAVIDEPSADGAGWSGSADGGRGGTMRITAICTPGSATRMPEGT